MSALQGKVAVVTGGASGLGLAIAHALAAEGAAVAVVDLADGPLAALDHASLHPFRCDVTDETQVAATVADVTARLGKIAILVNNVGILYSAPLVAIGSGGVEQHSATMWERVLATNLTSAFLVGKHVAAAMLKARTKGTIVNISSVSARGNAGQSAYAAAKAGLEALTKVWAKELGPMGIRCFAVAPGFCETPSTHAAMKTTALDDIVARSALKRLGKPEEIAAAVVAGIKNGFLTGTVLALDGGLVV